MKRFLTLLAAGLLALTLAHKGAEASTITLAEGNGYVGPLVTNNAAGFTLGSASPISFSILADVPLSTVSVSLCSTADCGSGYALVNVPLSSFTTLALAAGNYFYKLAFSAGTIGTYSWKFTAEAAVTPIPGALLMFVTALGGLGLIGYRRRSQDV